MCIKLKMSFRMKSLLVTNCVLWKKGAKVVNQNSQSVET